MNSLETKHVISVLADHFILSRHLGNVAVNNVVVNGSPIPSGMTLSSGAYAMYFTISFDMQNYGYEKDGNTFHKEWTRRSQRVIHIMITRRYNVFVAVTHPRDNPRITDWTNTSNHDSCWRSDGLNVLDQVAWDAYEHCFAFMPDEHRPVPGLAHSFVQFADWHFGRAPFKIVKLKGEYSKSNDHRWSLTEVTDLECQLNILEKENKNESV